MTRMKPPRLQITKIGSYLLATRSRMAILERGEVHIALDSDALTEVMSAYLGAWCETLMLLASPTLMGFVTESVFVLPTGRRLHISSIGLEDGVTCPFVALVEPAGDVIG